MKNLHLTIGIMAATLAGVACAQEGPTPKGVPTLDHVFVIMMENHGIGEIINNPAAPFLNKYARGANSALNYFGVAHPSLTNYLETVGGSNFGIHTDQNPDWHNLGCQPNLATKTVATDNPASPAICPIWGTGQDAETPAIDLTNEAQGLPGSINIDGTKSIAADPNIVGKTIADQLAEAGREWKSYQESAPAQLDGVNYSDGYFSNLTDFTLSPPQVQPPLASTDIVALYAVKHNPFAYFRSVQEATNPLLSLHQTRPFIGLGGLYADLASGNVPAFSFIAPNQCDDQHGRGNAGAFCNFDPISNGQQSGLNPALIYRGDVTVEQLVTAIHGSPAWKRGKNAIVVLWDENDYAIAPVTNQVLLVVDTNYGVKGTTSGVYYNHFSVLKSIEAGLGLPCLNHACDADVKVMSDLFAMAPNDDRAR